MTLSDKTHMLTKECFFAGLRRLHLRLEHHTFHVQLDSRVFVKDYEQPTEGAETGKKMKTNIKIKTSNDSLRGYFKKDFNLSVQYEGSYCPPKQSGVLFLTKLTRAVTSS